MIRRTVPNKHRQADKAAISAARVRARVASKDKAPRRQTSSKRSPVPSLVPERPRLPDPDLSLAAIFDSAWWARAYGARRSECHSLTVYIAGCLGTSALAATLGIPAFKVGTAEDCEARIVELNGQRYGSHAVVNGRMVEESGYDTWQLARLSAPPTHPMSPVRVMPRWLVVDLPSWLSPSQFEFMINCRLMTLQLVRIAGTSAGRALCRQRSCDPDRFMRYSRHGRSLELATELACIAPSADATRLIGLIEAMLVAAVRAHVGRRG